MKFLFRFFSSIWLTVTLLTLGTILIFFGTLAQVDIGVWEAQRQYFQSFVVVWEYAHMAPGAENLRWLKIPLPGGYLIGGLLLINLIVAHFRYYRSGTRKLGIAIIHLGIVLLLIGQLLTDIGQEEYSLWISEGETVNYMESFFHDELVIIDRSNPKADKVVSIPASLLKTGASFQLPELPFRLNIKKFYPNATIASRASNPGMPSPEATHGYAANMDLGVVEAEPVYKQNTRNATTATVEVVGPQATVGTWLVSNVFTQDNNLPPQRFTYEGKEYAIALRIKRKYLPFTIYLEDFRHDRYPGTNIARNFSSDVIIDNPAEGEKRTAKVYMNNPLRYGGYAFFQASFNEQQEVAASMFQVVKNPSWRIPYIACLLVSFGLAYQFVMSLIQHLRKRAKKRTEEPMLKEGV